MTTEELQTLRDRAVPTPGLFNQVTDRDPAPSEFREMSAQDVQQAAMDSVEFVKQVLNWKVG